jgi:hypothetical protein
MERFKKLTKKAGVPYWYFLKMWISAEEEKRVHRFKGTFFQDVFSWEDEIETRINKLQRSHERLHNDLRVLTRKLNSFMEATHAQDRDQTKIEKIKAEISNDSSLTFAEKLKRIGDVEKKFKKEK